MTFDQARLRRLYELSRTIGLGETVQETAEQALSGYVAQLDCTAGVVFECKESPESVSYDRIAAIPDQPQGAAYDAAVETLPGTPDDLVQFREWLPITSYTAAGSYCVLALPGFGVLVLTADDGGPDQETIVDLQPLNERLAAACRRHREAAKVSERGNLEELYEQTGTILDASGRERICTRGVQTVAELLDGAIACLALYDRAREALVPVAAVGPGTVTAFSDRANPVWEAYTSGELTQLGPGDELFEGVRIEGGIALPLGDHGVFLVSSLDGAVDEADTCFARLLATVIEIALDREERERGLEAVQEITRSILTAESQQAVAEETLARLPDALDLPISAIWAYDGGQQALTPLASTERSQEVIGEIPTFEAGEGLAWQAYEDGEAKVFGELSAHPSAHNDDSAIESEIIVPIGEFGVLATGSTHRESFTQAERRLLETLGANIATAMRLVSRRQELQLQDEVLARILRHNIRNDLTVVQGFASGIASQTDGEAEQLAQRIIERCEQLETTAKHAREMQDIVRSSDERAVVSLPDVVRYASSTVRNEFPDAEIVTRCEAESEVSAHPELTTAIRHLIENGIEHHPDSGTEEGETPRVEVRVFETDAGVALSVEDNAGGIPEAEIEILAQRGEDSLEHGSGAGLWIVDRVTAYSGADIEFERSDGGTTATVWFG